MPDHTNPFSSDEKNNDENLCRNFEKSFLKWEKKALRKIFWHILNANFFMFILVMSNHTVFLHLIWN